MHGTNASSPTAKPSGVDDVKAIDVLGGINGGNYRLVVDMRRQRQLDKDAVHGIVGVQALDQAQSVRLCEMSSAKRCSKLAIPASTVAFFFEPT